MWTCDKCECSSEAWSALFFFILSQCLSPLADIPDLQRLTAWVAVSGDYQVEAIHRPPPRGSIPGLSSRNLSYSPAHRPKILKESHHWLWRNVISSENWPLLSFISVIPAWLTAFLIRWFPICSGLHYCFTLASLPLSCCFLNKFCICLQPRFLPVVGNWFLYFSWIDLPNYMKHIRKPELELWNPTTVH